MPMGNMTQHRYADIIEAFSFLTQQGFTAEALPGKSDHASLGGMAFRGRAAVVSVEKGSCFENGFDVIVLRPEDYHPGRSSDWDVIQERGTAPYYTLKQILDLRPEARAAFESGLLELTTGFWRRGDKEKALATLHARVLQNYCADLLAGDFRSLTSVDRTVMEELDRRKTSREPF